MLKQYFLVALILSGCSSAQTANQRMIDYCRELALQPTGRLLPQSANPNSGSYPHPSNDPAGRSAIDIAASTPDCLIGIEELDELNQ